MLDSPCLTAHSSRRMGGELMAGGNIGGSFMYCAAAVVKIKQRDAGERQSPAFELN